MTAPGVRRRRVPRYAQVGIVLTLILSFAIAYGAATGRVKFVSIALVLAGAAVVGECGLAQRRKLFAAGLILSVFALGNMKLPYGIVLSEVVFAAVLAGGVLRPLPECGILLRKDVSGTLYIPLVALALIAGGSAAAHGELANWHVVYALPLLVFLIAFQVVRGPSDAHGLLIVPVAAVAVLQGLVALAKLLGVAVSGGAEAFRYGFTEVAVGPLHSAMGTTPIPMGTILALCAAPLIVMSTDKGSGSWRVWASRALFPVFAILTFLTGSRGPIFAFMVSATLTTLLLFETRRRSMMLGLACLGLVAAAFIASPSFIPAGLTEQSTRVSGRVFGSQAYGGRYGNAALRVGILRESIGSLSQQPFGRGFSYLRSRGVDESIVYSIPVNGMGYAGIVVMAVIVTSASWRFLQPLVGEQDRATREVATVGIATVVVALIAGAATDVVLSGQIAAPLVWFLACICYAGLTRPVARRLKSQRTGRADDPWAHD